MSSGCNENCKQCEDGEEDRAKLRCCNDGVYVVELEEGLYKRLGYCTTLIGKAERFKTVRDAREAIRRARLEMPLKNARVKRIPGTLEWW